MSLQEKIQHAAQQGQSLAITGGGSKSFLSGESAGEKLSTLNHAGVIDYQPRELVIKARAGTALTEIESTLHENGQMLPFEPPHYGSSATLGGTIACGLSGPGRPWRGAARDFVLGATIINGRGEQLRFGGEVIKNVAGYDVARLMAGSFGTLGLILDLSIKTQPLPQAEVTLALELDKQPALQALDSWVGLPLPLSAAAWYKNRLYIRFSGSQKSIAWAKETCGGEAINDHDQFWKQLREHELDFYNSSTSLWRLSLPRAAGVLDLPGEDLIDWGGAQRWLLSDADATLIKQAAASAGGYATAYRPGEPDGPFSGISPVLRSAHKNLKAAFDPDNLFNSQYF